MDEGVILYIGGFELPDKNAAAHRVISNAKMFKKKGKQVVFVGVDKSLKNDSRVLNTHSVIEGFDTFAVPYPKSKKSWIKYLTDITDYIEVCEKIGNVKMIIMYNFQAIAMKKLMHYCRHHKILCWADVTEWRSSKGEGIVYRVLKDSDTWYRMKILHKKMDGLIVISRFLEEYYKNVKNTIYIPALVDCLEKKWENCFVKSDKELRLVYAGNPGRKDRLDILIDALCNVTRKYKLDIIGITEEQFLQYYPRYKKNLSNNNSIEFHGRLSHLETLDYIKKANYSCFFRENDRVSKAGFPTKFAEAITCGTPVITNNTSNLSEYADGKVNGYLLKSIELSEIESTIQAVDFVLPVQKNIFDYETFSGNYIRFGSDSGEK